MLLPYSRLRRALILLAVVCVLTRMGMGQSCSITATVHVVDQQLQPVVGLTADRLRAEIEGVPASVSSIAPAAQPTLIVMIDVSSSEKHTWSASVAAAKQLVAKAGDDVEVITFDIKIDDHAVGRLESERLLDRTSRRSFGGGTALYDSLVEAGQQARGRDAAIVMIGDGDDNYSHFSADEVVNRFLDFRGPPVFGLILAPDRSESKRRQFKKIADSTGGVVMYPQAASGALATADALAGTLFKASIITLEVPRPITKPVNFALDVVGDGGTRIPNIHVLHADRLASCRVVSK